jgi:hypothetical protein
VRFANDLLYCILLSTFTKISRQKYVLFLPEYLTLEQLAAAGQRLSFMLSHFPQSCTYQDSLCMCMPASGSQRPRPPCNTSPAPQAPRPGPIATTHTHGATHLRVPGYENAWLPYKSRPWLTTPTRRRLFLFSRSYAMMPHERAPQPSTRNPKHPMIRVLPRAMLKPTTCMTTTKITTTVSNRS